MKSQELRYQKSVAIRSYTRESLRSWVWGIHPEQGVFIHFEKCFSEKVS